MSLSLSLSDESSSKTTSMWGGHGGVFTHVHRQASRQMLLFKRPCDLNVFIERIRPSGNIFHLKICPFCSRLSWSICLLSSVLFKYSPDEEDDDVFFDDVLLNQPTCRCP